MKTLLVVSGGDAPGINAVLAHYSALAAHHNQTVVGARHGFEGLLAEDIVPLAADDLAAWAAQPGTYLPSSRNPVLKDPDNQIKLAEVLDRHAIDAVILFGGDGTMRYIPPIIAQQSIRCIGLPTTIDNDVPGTELTLGFDSACNFAYPAIDGALATGRALWGRIFLVETLGGYAGMIALDVALGCGANAVVVPEYAYDEDRLSARLLDIMQQTGEALVIVSEGVAASRTLAETISQRTGIRVRDTRLGHGQRGARPTHRDRLLAAHMARLAFEAINANVSRGMVVVRGGQMRLHEGPPDGFAPRLPDVALYNFVNGLDPAHEPSIIRRDTIWGTPAY